MKTDNKYLAVGVTVIIASVLLIAMIFIFTGAPQWFTGGRTLKIHAEETYGLNSGSRIYLRGMKVGSVRNVIFTDGNPAKGVTIIASLDKGLNLPRKLKAHMVRQGLASMSSISLWPDKTCTDYYGPDETVVINSITSQANSLVPTELTMAMNNFSKLAATLNDMLTKDPQDETSTQPTTKPGEPSTGLNGTIVRLNRTLDSIYTITGNEKSQKNIEASLENISVASAQMKDLLAEARKTIESSQQLSRELITDAEDMSKLLQSFQKTANALNESKGTAGKLINDPQVYDSILQSTKELEKLIKELRHMTEKWRRDGVGVKLK